MNNGTHKNAITRVASANLDGGISVKPTAADQSKVESCAANDAGVIGVTAAPAQSGNQVGVILLGLANHTILAVASGAIPAGAEVCLDANGKVRALPEAGEAAQSVVVIGTALTRSYQDGDTVELLHRPPLTRTIPAA